MNREAWQATVHGVARVEHDLATKQQQQIPYAYLVPLTSCLPMVTTSLFSNICKFVSFLLHSLVG